MGKRRGVTTIKNKSSKVEEVPMLRGFSRAQLTGGDPVDRMMNRYGKQLAGSDDASDVGPSQPYADSAGG